jgi:hypothetical protein
MRVLRFSGLAVAAGAGLAAVGVLELLARVGAEGVGCRIKAGEGDDQDCKGDEEFHLICSFPVC